MADLAKIMASFLLVVLLTVGTRFWNDKERALLKKAIDEGYAEEAMTSSHIIRSHDKFTSTTLKAELRINSNGGMLEIAYTGVSIDIPPGTLEDEHLIEIKIILQDEYDESILSFTSNASVIVELLPNNIKLHHPVKVTLPHCLVFDKRYEPTATIYSSRHEGTQPRWEEEPNTHYEVNERHCVIWPKHFSRWKSWISDMFVTDKQIVLFAARSTLPMTIITFDIGYHWDLPGGDRIIRENNLEVLKINFALFSRGRRKPLTILFEKTEPSIWTDDENPKEISFDNVCKINGNIKTFVLKREDSETTKQYLFHFKAGQRPHLEDLIFKTIVLSMCSSELLSTPANADNTKYIRPTPPTEILDSVVSDDICQDLSSKIDKDWNVIARSLGISDTQLYHLEHNHRDLKEIIYLMFLKWKQNKGDDATYNVLANALFKAGRTDLRDYVQRYLREGTIV